MKSFTKHLITGATITFMATGAMAENMKELATGLLTEGITNGNKAYITEHVLEGYIQHNPNAPDKRVGLLGYVDYLHSQLPKPVMTPVRVLQDGDLVMVQSELILGGKQAVFDLFRFEDGKIAEHWDGIQAMPETSISGRTMLDGPTEITDLGQTAANKKVVLGLVTDILMNGEVDKITNYIGATYHQHNPQIGDGLDGLGKFMGFLAENNISFSYSKIHHVVAEGNFVFVHSEGQIGDEPQAFNDLFRVKNGMVVEHWDVVQPIPSEMAHANGMF